MCLYTKTNIPSVANKPIVCYKIMVPTPEAMEGGYRTPFTNFLVDGNVIDGKYNMVAQGDPSITKYAYNYFIGGGFIHCYTNKWRAIEEAEKITLFEPGIYQAVVFRCEIPAGVEYYKSTDVFKEVCAKEIKFICKVKKITLD